MNSSRARYRQEFAPLICSFLALDLARSSAATVVGTLAAIRGRYRGKRSAISTSLVTKGETTAASVGAALTSLGPHPTPYKSVLNPNLTDTVSGDIACD